MLYRLFWHPLANYPGPFLAKITDWYNVFHAGKGDHHVNLFMLHMRYGPIVRHGPNRLSFNDLQALRDIHSGYGTKAKIIKDRYYTVLDEHFEKFSIASVADSARHNRKRRIIGQALTAHAVRAMEENIIEHTRIYCDLLAPSNATSWSQAVDISQLTTRMTYDMMVHNVFGKSFDTLTSETYRWILSSLSKSIVIPHVVSDRRSSRAH